MKQSSTLIPTLQEIPSEIEVKSHKMLLRAGFIRQSTSGVYSYLPLAKRVINKLEKMIHEEMEALGAVEIGLPTLQLQAVQEKTNNFEGGHGEVFQVSNDNQQNLILAPSYESAITMLIAEEDQSYQNLPITFYQIQTKYRNEQRNTKGLLRSSEFLMKDAYSFHANEESLEISYSEMIQVYSNLFSKLGLHYEIIDANPGVGDSASAKEFIVASDAGDTIIAYSNDSKFAANIEVAQVVNEIVPSDFQIKPLEKVATPNVKTTEEVCTFFNIEETSCINAFLFRIDGEFVVVLARGDHQINPYKLQNVLKASSIYLATEKEVQELLGCPFESIGPIKLPIDVKVVADHAIHSIRNGVAGSNEEGYYYTNVSPERDFAISMYEDIRYIKEGDPSPDGQGTILFKKGIEVGKICNLGISISEKLNANFTDENGESRPILMNSFHLGISRILAVMAENYQDDNGFYWPNQIAPFDLHLIPLDREDEVQYNLALELYNILTFYQFEVLFDDREKEADEKFTDADLIGLPVRVKIGKRANEGIVEVKIRRTGETFEWAKEELIDHLNEIFRSH
ncbi:proline--tRNA ligase [Lysinibacillus sp. SGAir0095]|uniref:proline--tRNA ligase n=1 Tax=Lysinibacillus sp. SGAir0095 TaxID=2070463 RepID=UPI0010CD1F8E|nr:proline--tRNA ligase [Lysinibacillus sp. SGAir0095]QCR31834.1 proline--tRNA ligase [Lysinibacillus sp. SGAir0095]